MVIKTRNYRSVWNFADVPATEVAFRELLSKSSNTGDELCIQTQIARTLGLQGKFEEAHAVLDTIDEKLKAYTEDVDTTEAKVRSLMERGRAFRSSKKVDEALVYFLEAVDIAQKHDMDELAVDAMHMVALATSNTEESLTWSEKALNLALTSEDPDAQKWDASISNNMGWTYHDAGNFEKAMEYFKIALTARERLGAARQIEIARWMIARTHRSLKQYLEALVILHELEKLNNEDGYVSEELAENYEVLEEHTKAKHYFKLAYEKLKDDKSVEAPRLERMLALSQS